MATRTETRAELSGPEFTAKHRYARLTARKGRLVADMIRGRSANQALEAVSA